MKKLAGLIFAASFAILFAACDSKKPTTVVETQPEPELDVATEIPPTATEPVVADPTVAVPEAGTPPGDNSLLAALSPEERTKFEGWFKKHNLTPDPAVMDEDPDGDGYPNREEFLASTNPRDANSMPGLLEGVSVLSVQEVKVPMILREVKGDTAHVERTDALGTESLRAGSQPKGLPYKVTGVKHQLKTDKHGVLTDVSNVTLENTDSGETVVLVRDLPARSSETHAVVAGADGTKKNVHLDETVELPGLPGKQYKVLELREDQVVVEEVETKRALTIPKR